MAYRKPAKRQRLTERVKADESDKHRDGWQPWRSAAHKHYSPQYERTASAPAAQDMEA